jgi:hypothetical protein
MKQRLLEIIRKALTEQPKKKKCDCGCDECTDAPMLNESKQYSMPISENMRYHLDKQIPIHDNTFYPGSKAHIDLIHEARLLWKKGVIELQGKDKILFETTDLGRFGIYEGEVVPLDLPLIETLTEAEYQGRNVQLGKPTQGDVKKFKVYVKNAKGKVVKVNFGFGGKSAKGKRMVIKDKNPKRRAAFRARHNCENPGPRWKARYWSCRKW